MVFQKLKQTLLLLSTIAALPSEGYAQQGDTATNSSKNNSYFNGGKGKLNFSGYLQPHFQWAESKGASSYAGGNFPTNSDNRFTLRRGRLRADYSFYTSSGKPFTQFAIQFDGTERGVAIRDLWGKFYENKLGMLEVTAGMFMRPMGYELRISSSDRETPERGRMSQILMKTERDLGVMLSLDSRKKGKLDWLRADIGVFNGPGLAGPVDYDSHKDVIVRVMLKPQTISKTGITIAAGVSAYLGGINSQSAIMYKMEGSGANAMMVKDSALSNIDKVAPRRYADIDVQIKIPNRKGFTEFRAEYIRGLQTGTATSSETPGSYPMDGTNKPMPLYTRTFDGAYFYFLQHLGSTKFQLIVKYDWYDPNKKVKGKEIDGAKGLSAADVRFNTLGGGLAYYINPHMKAQVHYDWVTNETTNISGFNNDKKDNIFTVRLQYSF